MKRRTENRLRVGLWISYGVLSVVGLSLLALALFLPRVPETFPPAQLSAIGAGSSLPVLRVDNGLGAKAMTRRVRAVEAPVQAKAAGQSIESLIRLSGIMHFGANKPALAVIEILGAGETKTCRSGERVGETGIRVAEIGEAVIVEFENRRYRLTALGIQEVPARALGTSGSGPSKD